MAKETKRQNKWMGENEETEENREESGGSKSNGVKIHHWISGERSLAAGELLGCAAGGLLPAACTGGRRCRRGQESPCISRVNKKKLSDSGRLTKLD